MKQRDRIKELLKSYSSKCEFVIGNVAPEEYSALNRLAFLYFFLSRKKVKGETKQLYKIIELKMLVMKNHHQRRRKTMNATWKIFRQA